MGQLDAVAHPELVEDVRAVTLDGLLADHQRLGDLLAGVGLGDQLDDLLFARGERIFRDILAASRALEESRISAVTAAGWRNGSPRMLARIASTRSRLAADFST